MLPKKYYLKDGSIYWHKLYFDMVPKWMTEYSPPFGDYNYAAYLYQPHKYFIALYDEVKWFIQRGQRGYSDRDVWGWCSHHARMTVDILKYLRKYKQGCPIGLTARKWDQVLGAMQDGFQAFIDEEEDFTSYRRLSRRAHLKLVRDRQKKLRRALGYFKDHYCDLWD